MRITHNTTRPYKMSLFLLAVALCEVIVYLYLGNVLFAGTWLSFQ